MPVETQIEQTDKPVSRLKVVRSWLLLVGTIVFWLVFWGVHNHSRWAVEEQPVDLAQTVLSLFLGGWCLALGVGAYVIMVTTNALTFDFTKPVWRKVKTRVYFANIAVLVLVGLGLGWITAAFFSPVLALVGFDSALASMLPVFAMLGLTQAIVLWVLIWAPLEKRLINSRLLAQGITREQLQTGVPIGLSNPASGTLRRLTGIEEDVGALWFGPDHLVYRGDGEQLDITRDQLVRVERRADTRSTTMLSGTAHVILHLQQPTDSEREIRLHVEGLWTMGQKQRAMNQLAERINHWRSQPPPSPNTTE